MPILLPLAPADTLPERLGPAVEALLHRYGMALPRIERELAAMAEIAVAETRNRRVVGTMNELGFEPSICCEQIGATDLAKLSMRMAETPCGAIGYNSPDRLMLEEGKRKVGIPAVSRVAEGLKSGCWVGARAPEKRSARRSHLEAVDCGGAR